MNRFKRLLSIVTLGLLVTGLMPIANVNAAVFDASISGFRLVNAQTDELLSGNLSDNQLVNTGCVGLSQISVVAEVAGTSVVGSVKFGLDGNSNYRTENVAPYALAGDTSGDYSPWSATNGLHTITATPYALSGAGGEVGTPLSVTIKVTDDCVAPVITGVTDEGVYNHPVTPIFTEGIGKISKDGAPETDFLSGTEIAGDGNYALVVTDDSGNSAFVDFTIDMTAPMTPVLLSPADLAYVKPSALLKFDWADVVLDENNNNEASGPVDYEFEITAGPMSPTGNPDNSFSAVDHSSGWIADSEYVNGGYFGSLADATYFWNVRTRDQIGNRSNWSDYRTFVLDGTLPTLEDLKDVSAGAPTEVSAIASDDNGVSYKWTKVSGPGSVNFSSDMINNPVISADTNGDYVIALLVTDPAGNSVQKEMNFNWKVESVVLTPVVTSTPVELASVEEAVIDEAATEETKKEKREVKSVVTTDDKDEKKEEARTLPYFGFSILVLLVLFGLYLLYQQKPGWFAWMFFWRK